VTLYARPYITNTSCGDIVLWRLFTGLSGDCSPCTQPRVYCETLSAPLQRPCRPFPLCLCLCLPLLEHVSTLLQTPINWANVLTAVALGEQLFDELEHILPRVTSYRPNLLSDGDGAWCAGW